MPTKNLLVWAYVQILKRKTINECRGDILFASNATFKKLAGSNTHSMAEEIKYGSFETKKVL